MQRSCNAVAAHDRGRWIRRKLVEGLGGTLGRGRASFELIEEYNDDTFWDALISRLAERDVYEQIEENRRDTIGIEEYWARSEPIEEAYYEEFRRRALDRLRLVDG